MVLAYAATLDQRLNPPSAQDAQARAMVWSQTLDEDITDDQARGAVLKHYRESTAVIMPAIINRLCRDASGGRVLTYMERVADEPCPHGDPLGEKQCALCRRSNT
jgi:hypothetical protein